MGELRQHERRKIELKAIVKGIDPAGADLIPMEQYRQQQFDLLADGVRAALDLPAVYAAMGLAGPKGENA